MSARKGFFFHPEDWLSDTKLSLCSYAAKGLWMDLMCHMYQSKRRGYLMIDDVPLSEDDVFKMVKCRTKEEFHELWKELSDLGVMKRNADGVFFSKRMVEDVERISITSTASDEELKFAKSVLEELHRIAPYIMGYDRETAITLIISKYRNGAKFDDFQSVIMTKSEEWKDDKKMRNNIRPKTLFGDNFKEYVAMSKKRQGPELASKGVLDRRDYGYDL